MTKHCEHCGSEPLTRDSAQEMAAGFLEEAAEHVAGGRVSEAQLLNNLAQTALALADRLVPTMPAEIVH